MKRAIFVLSFLCLASITTAAYFWNQARAGLDFAEPLAEELAATAPPLLLFLEEGPAQYIEPPPITEELAAAFTTMERAGNGDPRAQYDTAMLFLNGDVLPPSRYLAAKWLALAAFNGSPRALALLADCRCEEYPAVPYDTLEPILALGVAE